MTGPNRRPPHVAPPQPPYQQPPYAGFPPVPPKRRKRWPWVVGILLVLIVIGAATGSHSTSTRATGPQPSTTVAADAAAAQPAQPAGPATAVGDGTYQVGTDLVPGRYKTPGPPPDAFVKDCYWSRNKNDSGQFDSIIANGNATGPGSVTVKAGEFFTTSGGCTWTKQ